MFLGIDHAQLECTFSGENPPKPGQRYLDDNGTEWFVTTVGRKRGILSDTEVWDITVVSSTLRGPIVLPLNLKRKYSASEIRKARQQLQDLGISSVIVDSGDEHLIIKADEVKEAQDSNGVDIPDELDGLIVVIREPK